MGYVIKGCTKVLISLSATNDARCGRRACSNGEAAGRHELGQRWQSPDLHCKAQATYGQSCKVIKMILNELGHRRQSPDLHCKAQTTYGQSCKVLQMMLNDLGQRRQSTDLHWKAQTTHRQSCEV